MTAVRHYVQLRHDPEVPARLLSLRPDGRDTRLAGGVPFTGEGGLVATVKNPGDATPFALTAFNVPLAARELADAIVGVAGADVQAIPVSVDGQPGMFALNSVRVIRCLDEARSDFRRTDGNDRYWAVYRLALDRSKIPSDAHFFRIEGWIVALIVSDAVKAAMEHAGCVGAKFIELPQ